MNVAHSKEQLRLFREVEGVEKALIQQIIKSVEAPYLAAIRDRVSNSLTGTVQQILDYLQTAYGQILPQMLEDSEQELRNLSYNPRSPIDVVFNAVEDYIDFAILLATHAYPILRLKRIDHSHAISILLPLFVSNMDHMLMPALSLVPF